MALVGSAPKGPMDEVVGTLTLTREESWVLWLALRPHPDHMTEREWKMRERLMSRLPEVPDGAA